MKKFMKLLCLVLCLILILPTAIACGGAIEFSGETLKKGKVGEEYSDTVATATGDKNITYKIKLGSYLPEGLEMSENGDISGIPTEGADELEIVIVALGKSAEKEATFTMTIEEGTLAYKGKALKDGETNEIYIDSVADASGTDEIIYALKKGSTLPKGLELSDEGAISGVPKEVATAKTFTVVASAEGFKNAEATFTITIAEGTGGGEIGDKIIYEGFIMPDATVGTAYLAGSVRTATGAPDISYKVKYVGGIGFPKGLTFNAVGAVVGTPADSSTGTVEFQVIASADGYDSVTATFFLNVLDVVKVTDRFELEHLDYTGKSSPGWSGTAVGTEMLQGNPGASNGKYLGYFNSPGLLMEFKINSDKAVTNGSLKVKLASEWKDMDFTDTTFKVMVNGVKLSFASFNVQSGKSTDDNPLLGAFQEIILTNSLKLTEGENIISFSITDNDFMFNGETAGPAFDYMEITGSGAVLSWRPKVSNDK